MTGLYINNDPLSVRIRVADIIEGTSVDGPGLRTTIYMAGCAHHCPGCHNPSTWDPAGGREISVGELAGIIEEAAFPLTLSGGDPLMQPEATEALLREIRTRMSSDIWLYTGYTFEEILGSRRFSALLPWLDVIVDGPFIESLKDSSLLFRGSANQRLIDIRESLSRHTVVEYNIL